MNEIGNVLDQDQSIDVAQTASQFRGQIQQVVLAQGADFHEIGKLKVGCVGFTVGTDQLFGSFESNGADALQKRNEPRCLALVREEEIHAIFEGFDAQTTAMSPVLENELLQIQKGTFVTDPLPHLDQRFPGALSKDGLTFDALLIANNELH